MKGNRLRSVLRQVRSQRAFTMLELIVVIAVVAILASVAVPLATVFEDRARASATVDELESLETALLAHYEDFGSFPAALADLETQGYLVGQVQNDDYSTDAWANAYSYTRSGMSATVSSAGRDFTASTADDISLSVSAGVVARERTLQEIQQIHVALRNYEWQRVSSSLPPLPTHWEDQGGTDGAYTMLQDAGLLPSGSELLNDAWGDTYTYAGTPVAVVNSPNIGTGAGGGGPT
ncbi:MAG: hypothetical protein DHS20C21_19050 [Gemmatimonadota bacterium]|nr:MAG: hypothetical protein DHS20C21_19050 [Gemmatimonadota bacterium]